MADLQQSNRYAYAGCNPVNVTDPSGLFFDDIKDAYYDAVDIAGDVSRFVRSGPGRCIVGGVIGAAAGAYFTGGVGATVGFRAGSALLGGAAGCGIGVLRRSPV